MTSKMDVERLEGSLAKATSMLQQLERIAMKYPESHMASAYWTKLLNTRFRQLGDGLQGVEDELKTQLAVKVQDLEAQKADLEAQRTEL
ncbi:MAG: hypothetical protein L6R35_007382, partial [Caloplaca aegaea]